MGLTDYYQRFVLHFSDDTIPLTDFTNKGAPNLVQWMEPCEWPFTEVKVVLSLLHLPYFLPLLICRLVCWIEGWGHFVSGGGGGGVPCASDASDASFW